MTKRDGLIRLAESEGLELHCMLVRASIDSVVPGICLECGYTATVEPDQGHGYCEGCERQSVQSCLILGGLL